MNLIDRFFHQDFEWNLKILNESQNPKKFLYFQNYLKNQYEKE